MKRTLLILICIGYICNVANQIQAQNHHVELLNKLVEKNILTQSEAEELLSEPSKGSLSDKVAEVKQLIRKGFNNSPLLEINGYGMLLYQYDKENLVRQNLSTRAIFLWGTGYINPKLSYQVMLELSSPTLFEYYLEWSPTPELTFRGGQFKVPFTLESSISLTRLESIFNSRTISALAGMATDISIANGAGGRDIGIQASGGVIKKQQRHLLRYAAGIFQGSGVNTADNNNHKDVAAMICLEPITGWRISSSIYSGKGHYIIPSESTARNHTRNRWAIGSDLYYKNLYTRVEHIRGNDGGINRHGSYGVIQCQILPNKWDSYLKFEHYTANRRTKSKAKDYCIGMNYYFAPLCRIQINYQYSQYNSYWESSLRNSHLLASQLLLYF